MAKEMSRLLDRPQAFEEAKARYILALEAQKKAQVLFISNSQRKLVSNFQEKLRASAVVARRHAKWKNESKSAEKVFRERRVASAAVFKSRHFDEEKLGVGTMLKKRPKTTGAIGLRPRKSQGKISAFSISGSRVDEKGVTRAKMIPLSDSCCDPSQGFLERRSKFCNEQINDIDSEGTGSLQKAKNVSNMNNKLEFDECNVKHAEDSCPSLKTNSARGAKLLGRGHKPGERMIDNFTPNEASFAAASGLMMSKELQWQKSSVIPSRSLVVSESTSHMNGDQLDNDARSKGRPKSNGGAKRKMSYEMRSWISSIQQDVKKINSVDGDAGHPSVVGRSSSEEHEDICNSTTAVDSALEKFDSLIEAMKVSCSVLSVENNLENGNWEIVDVSSLYSKSALNASRLDCDQKWHQRDPRNRKLKSETSIEF